MRDKFLNNVSESLTKINTEIDLKQLVVDRAWRECNENNAEIAKLKKYAEIASNAGNTLDAELYISKMNVLISKNTEKEAFYKRESETLSEMRSIRSSIMENMSKLD
jgi:hypothetical protein